MINRLLLVLGLFALAGNACSDAPPRIDAPVQVAQAPAGIEARRDPRGYPAVGTGHLSVRGADILGPDGNPILLRGWNWGRWGKTQPQDGQENASQGANVVRIPLRWWGLYGADDVESRNDGATATAGIDPAHLQLLDNYVQWASRSKLWIVLFIDSNCGQNGTQNAQMVAYCDPGHQYQNGHNFWTDPAAKAKFISIWRFIANRYKDTPYMGMFEPLPEPNPPSASPADINQFYVEVTNAIRSAAPGIPLLVGGPGYKAQKIRSAYNPAWRDVVYTGNLFVHKGDAETRDIPQLRRRLDDLIELRNQNKVPIFVQQVGVRTGDDPDNSTLRNVLGLLNQNRIGFTYWEYRDSNSPKEFGAYYRSGKDWVPKPNVISNVSSSFRQ